MSIYFYSKGNTPVGMNNSYEVGALNYPFNYPKKPPKSFSPLFSNFTSPISLQISFKFPLLHNQRQQKGEPGGCPSPYTTSNILSNGTSFQVKLENFYKVGPCMSQG